MKVDWDFFHNDKSHPIKVLMAWGMLKKWQRPYLLRQSFSWFTENTSCQKMNYLIYWPWMSSKVKIQKSRRVMIFMAKLRTHGHTVNSCETEQGAGLLANSSWVLVRGHLTYTRLEAQQVRDQPRSPWFLLDYITTWVSGPKAKAEKIGFRNKLWAPFPAILWLWSLVHSNITIIRHISLSPSWSP